MNFVESCLKGELHECDIEQFVADWHEGASGQGLQLHEHLGMNWEEYRQWTTNPSELPSILAAHAPYPDNHAGSGKASTNRPR